MVKKNTWTNELSTIIVLGSLGGVASAPIGYIGRLLSTIPFLTPVFSQAFSGVHVFWLILAVNLVGRRGASTMTGALKGLVEAFLFSHLGILVILISTIEGIVMDVVFYVLGRYNRFSIYLAGGFSSASNVIALIPILQLPVMIVVLMFFSSYISGLLFGGYLGKQVFKALPLSFKGIL